MANDPVLQRPLFQGMAPSTPTVTGGITSVPTPEENARELRNMFAPVQSFQGGGLAIGPSTMEGFFPPDMIPVAEQVAAPTRADTRPRPETLSTMEGFLPPTDVPMSIPRFPVSVPAAAAAAAAAPAAASNAPPGGIPMLVGKQFPTVQSAPEAAPEEGIASIKTNLSEIREDRLSRERAQLEADRRARTAADRRENALLALLQAGLAMAGGTSPNAITNIGAGGQAGVAAFANMERARREDEASRRREETSLLLAREQMRAQEERAPEAVRTAAFFGGWNPSMGQQGLEQAAVRGMQVMREMEKDPEMVRTYAILGGYDPKKGGREGYMEAVQRGYQLTLGKEGPARAEALLKLANNDPTLLTDEQKKRLTNIAFSSVVGMTGAGQTPPPNATVIPWTQLPVR